ncbi:MAG: helix-turn-helix domain-containing protein [Verrucomicrobiia bacterium]
MLSVGGMSNSKSAAKAAASDNPSIAGVRHHQAPAPVELLTDEQAAAELAVQPRTIRLWRRTRGLPHIKLTSKCVRIRRGDLNAWLSRNRVAMHGG